MFRAAHTAYGFTDEPVTAEQLERLHDLLRHPPTAMNTQPLRVVLVSSPEAKGRLLAHLAEGWSRARRGAAGCSWPWRVVQALELFGGYS